MKILLLLLMLSPLVYAQEFEYGSTSDLKGKTKVFINTGTDTKARETIIKALDKAKLGVEVVSDVDDSEILIMFGRWTDVGIMGIPTPNGTQIIQPEYPSGQGSVWVRGKVKGKPKLIFSFDDVQSTAFERKPITNFCKKFIKEYKKANDIK